jgi:hypothetical protein
MKEILSEQSRRRKRRQKSIVRQHDEGHEPPSKQQKHVDDVSGGQSRSSELNTLVNSIKRKVVKVK